MSLVDEPPWDPVSLLGLFRRHTERDVGKASSRDGNNGKDW